MLFAGAGANTASAIGGALPFAVNNPPSWAWWSDGSANKCSLLVSVLAPLLS